METTHSEIVRARTRMWGLTNREWGRYKSLMQGIRGSISPATLSPIEVLGIHARDEEERRRYAEQWVQMMREDTDRVLAFQREYYAAWNRLYPNRKLLSTTVSTQMNFSSTDQLLFFVQPDCTTCKTMLRKLLRLVRGGRYARLDIYLMGTSEDDQAVRVWAQQANIDQALVTQRKVTLNHDRGALAQLSPTLAQFPGPHLIRKRGTEYTQIEPETL